MHIISGGGVADGHAAGLMVAGDHNEGLLRMLLGKGHGFFHRVSQGKHIVDHGAHIVGVAGPVDLAAFHHHEETLLIAFQGADACGGHFGQAQVPAAFGQAIDFVFHGLAVPQLGGDGQHAAFLSADGPDSLVGVVQGEAVLLGDFQQILLGLVRAGGLQEAAAAQEIHHVAGQALHGDVIIGAALGGFGIVGRGGGMVQGHAGDHAHLHAGFLGIFGDDLVSVLGVGLKALLALLIAHVDAARQDAVAGGHGGGGGGAVRGKAGGIIGEHLAGHRESGEAQRCLHRRFALSILLGAKEVLRGRGLGIAHAVADKEEDVLGSLGGSLCRKGGGDAQQHQRCQEDRGDFSHG